MGGNDLMVAQGVRDYSLIGPVKDLPTMSYVLFRMSGDERCLSVVEHDKVPPADEDWIDNYVYDMNSALEGSFCPELTIVFTAGGLPTSKQRHALKALRDRGAELGVDMHVGVVTSDIITRVAALAVRQFGARSLIACKNEQSLFDHLHLSDDERQAVTAIRLLFRRRRD